MSHEIWFRASSRAKPMVKKQKAFSRLLRQGVSVSEACRRIGVDRKTGHWWKNGGVIERNRVVRVVTPIVGREPAPAQSPRYLSLDERTIIADGHRAGRSARSIATQLGRAVSTVCRELKCNQAEGGPYLPHTAHASMLTRRPRPKTRVLASDADLGAWCRAISTSVETIYQALYSAERVVQRDASLVLGTHRPHRRPRRRGDQRRPRFIVPITRIE